jgi:hypothetical protein
MFNSFVWLHFLSRENKSLLNYDWRNLVTIISEMGVKHP